MICIFMCLWQKNEITVCSCRLSVQQFKLFGRVFDSAQFPAGVMTERLKTGSNGRLFFFSFSPSLSRAFFFLPPLAQFLNVSRR